MQVEELVKEKSNLYCDAASSTGFCGKTATYKVVGKNDILCTVHAKQLVKKGLAVIK